MPETSERPPDDQVTAHLPASPEAGPVLSPLEPVEPYRPLSILAMVGLGLAVLYSACVLVGGLVPFGRAYPRSFLLLVVLVPTAAALAMWLSRERRVARIARVTLAALGGLIVLLGLGGLLAFSGSNPWLMDNLTWLLVGAALL